MIPTFQRIGICKLAEFLEDHPTATLLGHLLVPIFRRHVLQGEVAVFILKVHAVQRKEFSEKLGLHLLCKIVKGIPIEKVPFLSSMSMQVGIKEQSFFPGEVFSQ